jgi:hypothetical protein
MDGAFVDTPAPPAPTAAEKDSTLTTVAKFAGLIAVVGCTAMLVFEIYAVFWTMEEIWYGMEGWRLGILFLVPFPVVPFYVAGVAAKFYYLFLVLATLVSFVLLMYNSREGIARVFKGKLDKLDDMPLYGVVTMFAMYISINLILVLIVLSFGYEPTVPDDPAERWQLWYSLLNASVWEEVICRVLMIGVPLMIAGIMMNEKGSWKRLFGRSEMNRLSVILIIVSAAIFAYGHLDSWDLFKLVPVTVCGLALGYLFVRYGLYAAIMMHFLVDFMESFTWIYDSIEADMMVGFFALGMVVLGLPFIVIYGKRGLEYLRSL